jgi:peptidoglycan/LPS O-acetylase OafA/YrhL
MALLSFGIAMHDGPAPFRSLILTLSTCSMFTTSEFFPTINGPFWSLAIEIWFSILFPAVLLAAVRFGFAKTLIAVGLLSLVVRIAGVGFPFTNVNVNPVKDSVLGRLDDFVVGMALAQLYAKGVLPRFTGRHALAGAAIIAMAAGLWDMSASLPGAAVALSNNVLQVGLALVLIAALNESNRVASILSAWPLRVAGAMCFSLYCWHSLLIGPELRGAPFDLINQALYWGTLILLAATTYRFIEFPRSNAADIFSLPTPPRPPVPVEKD